MASEQYKNRCRGQSRGPAKLDLTTTGRHRPVPLSWVESVDHKVRLSLPQDEAERRWSSTH
jgi:hypothetical protein